MNQWPALAIGIITYNRPAAFQRTWAALRRNIIYPNIRAWVVGDDGSDADYVTKIITEDETPSDMDAKILRFNRGGMGHNWNHTIAECEQHADLIFMMQDDWLLTEPLDLRLGVAIIEHVPNVPRFGFVRYHKLTGHMGLPMKVYEWDTDGRLEGFSDGPHEYEPQRMNFLDLLAPRTDVFSPYSGGAQLRHRGFTAWYGQYIEGKPFSDTEFDFMRRVNNSLRTHEEAAPRFAMFPHYFHSRFLDISEHSYRNTSIEAETLT